MNHKRMLHIICVLTLVSSLLTDCKKEADSTPADPLANAAGTYSGTLTDRGTSYLSIKATVTTGEVRNKLCVTSIGFSSTSYQLVLTGNACDGYAIKGTRNGYTYSSSSVIVDGKTLNLRGEYVLRNASGVNPAEYAYFSFTGTR